VDDISKVGRTSWVANVEIFHGAKKRHMLAAGLFRSLLQARSVSRSHPGASTRLFAISV